MKSNSLLLALLLIALGSHSQTINYQKSYQDALSVAGKNNKPIFLLVSAPKPAVIPEYAIYKSGLDSKEAVEFYNKKFVCYEASIVDSVGMKIRDQYHLTYFPAYIFLDSKGQLLSRSSSNSPSPQKYLDIANQALNRLASGKTIGYYEQLRKESSLTAEQLKDYIILREELEIFDNASLIDEYVNYLTIKELDEYNTVLFLLKAGPYAYGKVYSLCFTNKKMVDSIFKKEPNEVRSRINNNIILNTRNEAIKTKNVSMAQQVASFVQTTWGKNYQEGSKNYLFNMLIYYKGVKDTMRYYQQASIYYDRYYLNISADSAKKLQQKTMENLANKAAERTDDFKKSNDKRADNTTVVYSRIKVVQGSPTLEVANVLNNAAYDFYAFGTHSNAYLIKALVWCKRAIELQPKPGYYDTMAHIMYRLNFYDEAILNQKKAIEMSVEQSEQKDEQDHLKLELEKMKGHKL